MTISLVFFAIKGARKYYIKKINGLIVLIIFRQICIKLSSFKIIHFISMSISDGAACAGTCRVFGCAGDETVYIPVIVKRANVV